MAVRYKFAICNELFGTAPLDSVCRRVKALGYEGLEIAPFTLTERPGIISAERRNEIHKTLSDEGLFFVGLHWLLVSAETLHVTTRDNALRQKSWQHVHDLIDLCADLCGCKAEDNGVLVFGSPKQRSAVDGMSPKEAVDVFTSELGHLAPHAESRGVRILIEALPANQSNVINSLAEAVSIVKQIGSPAIKTMFDTHNAVDEREPHPELLRRYLHYIAHVHVNENDGREPGKGDYDFATLLSSLSDLGYHGFVSLEAFDFSRDPDEIAAGALNHLRANLPKASAASTNE